MKKRHIDFFTSRGLDAKLLHNILGWQPNKSSRILRGLRFISLDDYKELTGDEYNAEDYLLMKKDFEHNSPNRVLIHAGEKYQAWFYPRISRMCVFENINLNEVIDYRVESPDKAKAIFESQFSNYKQ